MGAHEECITNNPRRTALANRRGEERSDALRATDLSVREVRGAHRPRDTAEVELHIHCRTAG